MQLLSKLLLCVFSLLLPFSAVAQPNNQEKILATKAKAEKQYESKNYGGALVEYLEVVKLGGDPVFLYNIAICYKLMGNLYDAQKYFDEYKKEDATGQYLTQAEEQLKTIDKDIKSGKGSLTPSQKNARKYYEKATRFYEDALKVMAKDIDKAHSLFDESAKNYILSYGLEPDAWKLYNTAQAYRLAGNEPEATTYYKKYIETANKNEKFSATKERIASSKKHLSTLDSISQDNFDRLPDIPLPDLPVFLSQVDPPRRKWPFIVAGVGVAVLAGGAIVFLSTQ